MSLASLPEEGGGFMKLSGPDFRANMSLDTQRRCMGTDVCK